MTVNITGRNFEMKATTRAYVERKLRRLTKISRQMNRIDVTVTLKGMAYEADLRIKADKGEFFSIQDGQHLRDTIDRCLEKLERQMKSHTGRLEDKRRRAAVRGETIKAISLAEA